jgi:hypothetical protein
MVGGPRIHAGCGGSWVKKWAAVTPAACLRKVLLVFAMYYSWDANEWKRTAGPSTALRSVENISTRGPLNCRSLGYARMTKGRVTLTSAAVIGDGQSRRLSAIFISLGAPKAHDHSGLQFFQPLANSPWKRPSPLCHPERSRGTCCAPFLNATVKPCPQPL